MFGLSAADCASTGAVPATRCQAGVGDSRQSFPVQPPLHTVQGSCPRRGCGLPVNAHSKAARNTSQEQQRCRNRPAFPAQPQGTASTSGTLQCLTQTQGSATRQCINLLQREGSRAGLPTTTTHPSIPPGSTSFVQKCFLRATLYLHPPAPIHPPCNKAQISG